MPGKRSDRNRVKWQADGIVNNLTMALEHAAKLDMINDKRSAFINEKLPLVVTALQLCKDLAENFRRMM